MVSTPSTSLRLELMATGDQSGTWGDTTNTNLGTLLEQAITGYLAIAKVGTGDYTLSNTDYLSNETRNALIEFTGTPGGAFNVIVPLAEKLWVFKNSTNGAMTVKGATGTGIAVAVGTSRWLYCDGTNVLDALTGTLATQAASSVAITGGTVTGLTNLTLASGAATPATNNAAALGTSSLQWADLFLASGGVINFDNGDVTITEGTDTLAFAGAASGYTFSHVVTPSANDGAALGTGTVSWSDLFLASGGVINFNNGNYTLTHSAGVLTANGALSIGTGNALTTGTIELGAATDTTISRGAAGFIAVEGNRVPSPASQASGDILYRGATEWERLAKGTAAQVLTMNSGATAPEWADAGGGGWEEVAWTQPTTDQATIVFTGLSAYKFVHMQYAIKFTSSASTIALSARVSGGTWRTIGVISKSTSSGQSFTGHVEIAGFNQSNDAKVVHVFGAGSTSALDASDSANAMNSSETYINGFMPSWNEVWDELMIAPSSGSFEFSTADQRGYVYVYGQQ